MLSRIRVFPVASAGIVMTTMQVMLSPIVISSSTLLATEVVHDGSEQI
jgi:hypothetical protein